MRARFIVPLLSVLLAAAMVIPGSFAASAAAPTVSAAQADSPMQAADGAAQHTAVSALPRKANPAMSRVLRHTGLGFDACHNPSLDVMQAWRKHSPYQVIGIYIGGISATCKAHSDKNLTAAWVAEVHAMGWRTIPTYVGLQAKCATYKKDGKQVKFPHRMSANRATAAQQGKAAAIDAVKEMKKRDLGPGNPIYLDVEAWNHQNQPCTESVLAFADAWSKQLRSAGYVSGFYTSAGNGLPGITAAMSRQDFTPPDAVWFARWDGEGKSAQDVGGINRLSDALWPNQERIKQFRGGHHETWGGKTLNIDSNFVDGPVTGTVIGLNPASIPTVTAAKNNSITLQGSGGVKPYIFGKINGSLPAGLTMSRSGKITGVATKPGSESTVTIVVKDDGDPRRRGERTYTMYTTYSDVPAGHLFFNPVKWLALNNITFGYKDGSFRPNGAVTRGQMAAFLYRLLNPKTKAPACDAKQFSDVNAKSLFCQHITWMAQTGITSGYPNGTFRDDVAVSRGQMAAFLFRVLHPGQAPTKCEAAPFKDVPIDDKFCGHIAWLAESGITVGYGDGTFRPGGEVTRGAMSAFLQRLSKRL